MYRLKNLLLVLLILLVGSPGVQSVAQEHRGNLSIRFFKIGKADAFLLRTESKAVLIDTGEVDDAEEITEYLRDKEIKTLDCLILTHFDKRNIGSAPELLSAVRVEKVLMPDYEKSSNLLDIVMDALSTDQVEKVKDKLEFDLDEVKFTVYPAQNDTYLEDEDNDFSLVVSVTHGDNKFFFSGDIMSERISEMNGAGQLFAHTLIKMPCHGQNIEGLDELLDGIKPQITIISASEKNPPAGVMLANLDARGIRWYCTMNGAITLNSDGYSAAIIQNIKQK